MFPLGAMSPAGPPGVLMVSLVPCAFAVQASRQPQQMLQLKSDSWECLRKLWFPQHLWLWWRGRGQGWGLPHRRRSRLCVFRHWDRETWVSVETACLRFSHHNWHSPPSWPWEVTWYTAPGWHSPCHHVRPYRPHAGTRGLGQPWVQSDTKQ